MEMRVRVIQTAQGQTRAWNELEQLELKNAYNFRMNTIEVDSGKCFQTHMGFGGAFTEAAYTLANTSEENRAEIVKAYFNKETGLAYTLGRTTIHGCDFSLEPYTYIKENDEKLSTFNIKREEQWVIPFLRAAETEAGEKLYLLCSPWSPPAFMKDNNDINYGGKLIKKYYKTWAEQAKDVNFY